jgi:F-type H+-transporting ATPase subunit b
MLIDWFTVLAQIINFLILVWLMKRFLYKPVLHAIDERERKVAGQLADAEKKKSEAQREMENFKEKNETFDSQRATLFAKVTSDVHTERAKLLAEARKEIGLLKAAQLQTLKADSHDLANSITLRTQQEVFAIVRKVLIDLSGTTLEEKIIDIFVRRLQELDNASKLDFAKAIKSSPGSVVITSAFDLSSDARTSVQKALNDYFSEVVPVRFQTSAELIGGIEFTTTGLKVAWSIHDYLSAMNQRVNELIDQQTDLKAEPEVEALKKVPDTVSAPTRKTDVAKQAPPGPAPVAAPPDPAPVAAPSAPSPVAVPAAPSPALSALASGGEEQ